MSTHGDNQPLRELQWLAQYFRKHGHERKSREIFEQLKHMRLNAQYSLSKPDEASEVIELFDCDEQRKESFGQ